MHRFTFRTLFSGLIALAMVALASLWSFNVLSELFGGPQAQYRHAFAGLLLLFAVRLVLFGRDGHHTGGRHERQVD